MGHHVADDAPLIDQSDAPVHRASIGTLFTPRFRPDTIGLWASFFSCLLAVYLGFSWVPSMLTGAGFSSSVASTGITVFNLGGVFGALAGGVLIARGGSRGPMLAMTALAVASAAAMSVMPLTPGQSVLPVIAMLTITGALINGVQTTMYALAAHVYPAAVRATGVGAAVSFGRIGAVLSGYIGAWALEYRGAASFFGAVAVAMTVCWVGLAIVRRHVPGRT
jgi:AAHS family 4-hydroxybenzoate transporter-like MFS transporter